MHRSGNNKNIPASSNRPRTSNNSSFPNPNKNSTRRKNVSAMDTASHSEDIITVQRYGKSTLRALSDNESVDNVVEKAGSSLASFSRANTKGAPKKSKTTIQFEESSSSDSDGLFKRLNSKRESMRALSYYKTGDINEHAGESSNLNQVNQHLYSSTNSAHQSYDLDLSNDNMIYKNIRNTFKKRSHNLFSTSDSSDSEDSSTNSNHQSYDLDFSSDDMIYKNFINTPKKRPHNLFSTSDSSDSDTPVKQQRFRKRKRINSSSEDEHVNAAQTQRRRRPNQNDLLRINRRIHTGTQMTRQLRLRDVNNQRQRIDEMSRIMTGSESEIDSDLSGNEIIGRVVRRNSDEFTSSSNSSQENVMEDTSSDDQLNGSINSETITSSPESIQQNSRLQTQRQVFCVSTQTSVSFRNSELVAPRISPTEIESETSSDESSNFHRLRMNLRMRSYSNRISQLYRGFVSSSDSDDSLPFETRRVRGGNVQIHYSDSDSNSEQTLPDDVRNSETGNSGVSISPIFPYDSSSDSDADSEKCPICFSCFGSKEVASPESCGHYFCTKCIEEWAKSKNTCPIDRKLFNRIVVSRSFNNHEVLREIPVRSPSQDFTTIGNVTILGVTQYMVQFINPDI